MSPTHRITRYVLTSVRQWKIINYNHVITTSYTSAWFHRSSMSKKGCNYISKGETISFSSTCGIIMRHLSLSLSRRPCDKMPKVTKAAKTLTNCNINNHISLISRSPIQANQASNSSSEIRLSPFSSAPSASIISLSDDVEVSLHPKSTRTMLFQLCCIPTDQKQTW